MIKAGVINYGAGNIGNVLRALDHIGVQSSVPSSPRELVGDVPDVLILPGVGAFKPAAERLRTTGWHAFLQERNAAGLPIIGICLGMQLMCRASTEDGHTEGLGIFDADVVRLEGIKKIPHIGWNSVEWDAQLADERCGCMDFYFVHSYAVIASPDAVGTTEVDGVRFCSSLSNGSAAGFQFHPERSGPSGVEFFGKMIERAVRGNGGV